MRISVPWEKGLKTVSCRCDCEMREERLRAEEAERREAAERAGRLREEGVADDGYRRMVFAADDGADPRTGRIARRYVEKWPEIRAKNFGLLFSGEPGNGKTFFAACIANALIDRGYPALISTVPALIAAFASDYGRERARILAQIADADLLVLDDVGTERRTGYTAEKLFELVDARYRARKPLIVTTNLSLEAIRNPADLEYKRAFDRIIEMCTPVVVSAPSRRPGIALRKQAEVRELLGL